MKLIPAIKLFVRLLRTDSYQETFIRREFQALGYKAPEEEEDGPNKWIQENVLEIAEVFASQGHSGFSAAYCVDLLEKVLRHEPIGPLTGEDWEWNEVGEGVWQNNRCSHVFKDTETFGGQAYDIDGKILCEWCERDLEPDEPGYPGKTRFQTCYTSSASRVPITFPYTPTREYVDVPSGSDVV